MLETLTGFTVVAVTIAVGYVTGRIDLLGPHARHVLGRLVFFVLSPFLLFTVLAHADARTLFSSLLPVSAIAAVAVIALYALIARLIWKRSVGETVIGALSAGQANSNNIGIPLSLYLLGSATYPAPVILMQLLIFTPISLMILDAVTSEKVSLPRTLKRTVTNPIIIGSLLGTLVSVLDIPVPAIVMDPTQLTADAAVPVLLISYGISLHGQRILGTRCHRRDVVLATALKLIAMPAVAWVVADLSLWSVARRGAHRRRARRPSHRAEHFQLLPTLRHRGVDLARHRLPDHLRQSAGAGARDGTAGLTLSAGA